MFSIKNTYLHFILYGNGNTYTFKIKTPFCQVPEKGKGFSGIKILKKRNQKCKKPFETINSVSLFPFIIGA